jgi:membrane protein YqaA with SNARE-associated domain
MTSTIELAGDVVTAATALAGLLLVFMGAVAASFDSYQPQERKAVAGRYQRRAWFAFIGFVLAILSAVLALLAKWLHIECLAVTALAFLAIGFVWALLAAFFSVREIG